jgi:hypothetical protein
MTANRPAAPQWEPDPASDGDTLIRGDIRCRVWRGRPLGRGTWSAIVSQRGDATAAYQFETVDAAQAWWAGSSAARRAGKERRE